jgi:hypothetical protein
LYTVLDHAAKNTAELSAVRKEYVTFPIEFAFAEYRGTGITAEGGAPKECTIAVGAFCPARVFGGLSCS